MKMFSAIGRIPVLLAVFFAGLSGVQAEDSMTCRDNQAFLCTSKAGCGEVRALYARARRGDFEAMTAFGLRLVMGDGVVPDDGAAMHWFEKAAAGGDTTAQVALGAFLMRPGEPAKRREKGLSWLERAALSGNTLALTHLARYEACEETTCGLTGQRVSRWQEQARRQAMQDSVTRMEAVVAPYRKKWLGQPGEKDPVQAVQDVLRAAEEGDRQAQTLASVWYVSGAMAKAGLALDRPAGMAFLKQAAQAGDRRAVTVFAMTVLADTNEDDTECQEEAAMAGRWLEAEAEKGDGECMALYGMLLFRGIGEKADPDAGVVWLEKAARRQVPDAMLFLGRLRMMAGEEGVQEGRDEAAAWFAKVATVPSRPDLFAWLAWDYGSGEAPVAGEPEVMTKVRRGAEKGDGRAMSYLAIMYDSGVFSGRRFPCAALTWYRRSAELGEKEMYLPLAMTCAETGDAACARKWLDAAFAEGGKALGYGMVAHAFGLSGDVCTDVPEEEMAEMASERMDAVAKRIRWLHAEGMRGNAAAAAVLARLYGAGIGVRQDGKEALKWERLSERAKARRRTVSGKAAGPAKRTCRAAGENGEVS